MTAAPSRALVDRRLVIVTGKGGTGKTTIAAALALAAAQTGRRALVVEVGLDEQIPHLLNPDAPPAGTKCLALEEGVWATRIEPFQALAEYLGLQLGVRSLVDMVVRSTAFRQLMGASPGWRELITLGKIWHLAQQTDACGRARFDLIVVDAPSTGHGVSFLEVPRVVVSAVRAGPLREHTKRVERMLEDPEQTLVLPVALAEELPARETVELVERVREDMNLPIDRVVVNAVCNQPFPKNLKTLDAALARLPEDLDLDALPPPRVLASCARYFRMRHALNHRYLREITRDTQLPILRLPYLESGIRGRKEIKILADALLDPPEEIPS